MADSGRISSVGYGDRANRHPNSNRFDDYRCTTVGGEDPGFRNEGRRELLISADDAENLVPEIPPFSYKANKLCTLKAAFLQAILIITLIAMSIAFKATHFTFGRKCSNIAILLGYQVALWVISFFIFNCFEVEHVILRRVGYPVVSKVLRRTTSYQFIFISWWNGFSLFYLVGSILLAQDALCEWDVSYSALNLTVYCIIVHGFVFLVTILLYAKDVYKFNKTGIRLYMTDLYSTNNWRCSGEILEDQDESKWNLIMLLNRIEDYSNLLEFHENRSRELCRWVASRSMLEPAPRVL